MLAFVCFLLILYCWPFFIDSLEYEASKTRYNPRWMK